jgi:hypothetical protein
MGSEFLGNLKFNLLGADVFSKPLTVIAIETLSVRTPEHCPRQLLKRK